MKLEEIENEKLKIQRAEKIKDAIELTDTRLAFFAKATARAAVTYWDMGYSHNTMTLGPEIDNDLLVAFVVDQLTKRRAQLYAELEAL